MCLRSRSTDLCQHKLINSNPEAVRAFLKGWYDSIAFMKSHKAESVPIAAKVMGYTPRVAERGCMIR